MKIAILGDVHIGCRNDSQVFSSFFDLFYTNIFFPYLKEHGISDVIQMGDLFDRRKYINFQSLYFSKKYLFDPAKEQNIKLHVLVGNHDIALARSLDVNSPRLLLAGYDNINVIDEAMEMQFDNVNALIIPWICKDNEKEIFDRINSTTATYCFGHLEIVGFEMHRGQVCKDGLSSDIFEKFITVFSGHYHHKSKKGNIHYVGTPYEMSWADYDDAKGFHVFDTEDHSLTFVENPYTIYSKVIYDDSKFKDHSEILSLDFSQYDMKYVKVIVKKKDNPFWFDIFIDKLEKSGALDIQVVEDHQNKNIISEEELGHIDDTLEMLRKVIDSSQIKADSEELNAFLASLYNEASNVREF